ncbi:MFS transporter [Leifsonia sp. 22587]|uniref:MFS transporter n=1 Tax=Leifsonia sp. 22587 TaxID=3453946 RepID=UPI003F82CCB6
MADATSAPTALSSLRVPAFRALWLAGIASNIGAWMQTVGAQWWLVEGHSSAATVALVQTAASLPVLLLAIPAGVLGEFVDKRRLLIAAQTGQLAVVVVLTILTANNTLTPPILLTLTLLLGIGSAVQLPAYQAIVPEIVPPADIPGAASLSSVGVNIARVIGPAAGGLLVAASGVAAVFLVNAASFAVFVITVICWRSYHPTSRRPEAFMDATRAGLRYVRHSPVIRSIYLRLGAFLVPAAGMWALLPLDASARLHLPAGGYGLLLGSLGAGSVVGAFLLPAIRRRVGAGRTILLSVAVYGASCAALGFAGHLPAAVALLAPAGFAWLGVIATINAEVQAFLPPWVRTRGLSIFQLVLYGGTALGSWLSGIAADLVGVPTTLAIAGALVILVALSILIAPIADPAGIGRETVPLPLTDAPPVSAEASVDGEPVLVLVHYTVPESARQQFLEHMRLVEESRRRTGALTWETYREADDPGTITEAFTVASWREHLDQHADRLTAYDRQVVEAARAFSTTQPSVQHLIGTQSKTHHLWRPSLTGRRDR